MKATDNNNDSSSGSVDSNSAVSGSAKTKVRAKPIFVFVKQGTTEHPATIVDPKVLELIKELGPTGWRLTQLPDNEYIVIKWSSTGRRQPVLSTDVVLQDDDDYGCGGTDSTSRNRRSGRNTIF